MNSDSDSELRERVQRQAAAHAEATVYSLSNPYLSGEQKTEVEMWFQFPGDVSFIAMLACLVYSTYSPLSWYWIIGIPLAVNCAFGIVNWLVYDRRLLYVVYLSILHNFVLWIITLAAITVLVINGAYGKAALAFLLKLFLSVLFEPHIIIYSILSQPYGMNSKYVFFKRFYGHEFPFDRDMSP